MSAASGWPSLAGPIVPWGELARKAVHVAMGFVAFTVRFLGPLGSAALAAGAVLFNLLVMPRIGGRRLWRDDELARGASRGIVLYPLAVLLLVLLFHRRLEVAAAVWGILAFGDGMATLVGRVLGRRPLPWNPAKTWEGSAAYAAFGTGAATALLLWTAPGRYAVLFAFLICAATALAAALLESLPQGIDDNLGVPLVAGVFLFCLLMTQGQWSAFLDLRLLPLLPAALAVNLLLGVAAYSLRALTLSGLIAGVVLGAVVFVGVGWVGWLLLAAFVALGSAATRLGYRQKERGGLAQEDCGRRRGRHALAKASVAAAAALFAAATPYPMLFGLAFAAALATATADTVSSEIGQLWGRRTYEITTLRPVPPGTHGGVSAVGTAAGVLAASAIAVLGAWAVLYPWWGALAVGVAAVLALLLESLLGATLEQRALLDNEGVNFVATLAGALLAVALALLV
jgi:uncharacterized protein (TIGR00297 family)